MKQDQRSALNDQEHGGSAIIKDTDMKRDQQGQGAILFIGMRKGPLPLKENKGRALQRGKQK